MLHLQNCSVKIFKGQCSNCTIKKALGGDVTLTNCSIKNLGGGVAQWLGRRISDRGVPGSNRGWCTFRCCLEQSHLPCLVLVEPRKRWTDDRLGQTVTRLEITLCPRDLVFRPDNMDETVPHTYQNMQCRYCTI